MSLKSILRSPYLPSLILLIILSSYAFSNFSEQTVSVSVSKMNVLYLGVDNPIVVAISDVPSNKTSVESDDLNIEEKGEGQYILKGRKPGQAILKVKANGQIVKEERFRVKRIPDPIARINNSRSGIISVSELKASLGVQAYIECFDFDARCSISGFDIMRTRENEDPLYHRNNGAKYESISKEMINGAKAGDTFYYEKIKCKCPGDRVSRRLSSLVFQIR